MEATAEFIKAIEANETTIVEQLISSQPELASAKLSSGLSTLLLASYYRHRELIDILLRNRNQIDLHEASALGQTALVDELLYSEPFSVNSFSVDGFTPLGYACYFGHYDTAKLLIYCGASVNLPSNNEFKVSPIHSAVANQSESITQLLIDHKANVNATQVRGITALHTAAHNGNKRLIELLLNAGANKNAKMEDGRTPWEMAEKNHEELVELLC
ncbi:ankyrin repeat domain-containing protein [Solitalea canadensis]|uniref:Ankyrin repeat-containing protein n=1 Tax=Solitalea canadensis (strain ATCC 29591 / DSM 3403 / JCM 21819 / LMG 8368 / NBRC 15130 / NCIMB 12057 / USAM 9D) TaxID=929556 RepID=H8KUC6_SOLCM|nr:ankyrin repeat domain-containing protein [Solitalea canadensis]AFD07291.1 ankyrin repeat-containing protein [Solitalea canadensis DSM 3403]